MTNGTNYRWIGAIAALSDGTISHCSNHGDFSLRNSASLRVGGIVGQVTGGSVSDCTNAGDLNITACSYACLGGIVGRIQSGTSASVSQAENSGALSAVSNLTTDENEIGGIVGSSTINLTLSDATNKGTITFSRSNLDINVADNIGGVLGHNSASASTLTRVYNDTGADISATINRGSVGGVVGWGKGATVGTAWNKGNIDVSGNSSFASRSGIGGVVGTGDKNLTDCNNYGTVTVSSETESYVPYIGGVCGAMEAAVTLSNCFNRANGTIVINIINRTYAGGVLGYGQGCSVSGSQNQADITVAGCDYMNLGGIAGFIETDAFAISDVENSGSFNLKSSSGTNQGTIGGILGKAGKALTLSDATNKGDILFVKQTLGVNNSDNIGGLVGEFTTDGSTATRIYNEGNIDVTIARGAVGGIAGWGQHMTLSTAWNKGRITVSGNTSNNTRSGIGGILGEANFPVSSADNYGSITVRGNGTSYNPKLGGIVGEMADKQLIQNCENKSGVTLEVISATAYVGGILGCGTTGTNGTDNIKSCNNNGTLISVTSTGTAFVGGIAGEMNTGDIRSCVNNCPLVAHIGGNACVGGVRGNCTGAGRTHASRNTAKVEAYVSGTSYARLAGIAAQTNGQLNTCTNSGELYLESSAPKSYIGGVGSQNGANGATSASNAPISFKYTGSAASPEIYAAYGVAYQSGATPTYYGTYGGRLTIDTGSATSPVVYCGALIGLLTNGNATFGTSTNAANISSSASLNGRIPSSDSASDDYYASESFLVGSIREGGSAYPNPTVTLTNVKLL